MYSGYALWEWESAPSADGKYAGGYFSVVIGTGIGLAIHLGERINAGAGVMQRVIGKFIKNSNSELSEDEFMNTLVTIIVLFCASGTGIYGSIVSGMSGDHSVLISNSILDYLQQLFLPAAWEW